MRLLIVSIILLCIYSCTKEVAGPTTEQGNPQITAVIVDSLRNPIAGVTTSLLVIPPDDTNSNFDSLKKYIPPANAVKINISKSNSDGECFFSDLASGSYRIVAVDTAQNLSVISENITINTLIDTSLLDTLVLRKTGRITGVVSRKQPLGNNTALQNGFIQVRIIELDRFNFSMTSGIYIFDSLPSGKYTLYYYASGFYVAHVENIIVEPRLTTTIDTVSLETYTPPAPTNFQAQYDRSAGVVHFSWYPIQHPNHIYYEVKRECFENATLDKKLRTTDVQISDSLATIPDKTKLRYVVYSIDKFLNEGSHSLPVSIQVVR